MSQKAAFHRNVINILINLLFLFLVQQLFSQGSLNTDTSAIRKILNQSDDLYKKNNVKSLQLAKNALEASKKAKFKKGEATANKYMARIYTIQFHFDSAVNCYNNSLQIYKQIGKKSEFFSIYNSLGIIYGKQSNYTMSRDYFQLSRKAAVEANNISHILSADNNLVIVYRYLGLWDSCLYILDKIEKQASEIADTSQLAYSYREKGIIFFLQGRYKQALDCHYRSLDLLQSINDKKGVLLEKEEIALLYLTIHDYGKTLELLKNILPELSTHLEDHLPILNNIGLAFQGLGLWDSALIYHRKSLELAKAKNIQSHIARSYNQLGEIQYRKGEYPQALELLANSVDIFRSLQMKRQYAEAVNALSKVQLATDKINMAEKGFLEVLTIAKELNIIPLMSDASEGLHQVNAKKNNYKKAYAYALSFKAYSDSTFNRENVKNATKRELEYEFENQNRKIEYEQMQERLSHKAKLKQQRFYFLGSIITLVFIALSTVLMIRQKNLRVKLKSVNLEQKLLRTQMDPHFIFNSLCAVQDYILDNKANEANLFLSQFSALIRSVLESSRQDYVTLENEILSLKNYIEIQKRRFEKDFEYTFDVDNNIDIESIAIPPMLAQPFIENSIEHGLLPKKEKGMIAIRYMLEKDLIRITIEDNGIGRKKSGMLKKNNLPGKRSLAIQLTGERFDYLKKFVQKDSGFWIEDTKSETTDPGTKVTLLIPFKRVEN